jgi:hypothetical protein
MMANVVEIAECAVSGVTVWGQSVTASGTSRCDGSLPDGGDGSAIVHILERGVRKVKSGPGLTGRVPESWMSFVQFFVNQFPTS